MIEELRKTYLEKREAIRARLAEFEAVLLEGDDQRLFEELVFCIFTAGASAWMGLNSIERVRPHLLKAGQMRLTRLLLGAHRYPNARSGYVIHTRNFLKRDLGLRIAELVDSLGADVVRRRYFFSKNFVVKGIGDKEVSHYLRNIGYRGYAILDKHILRSLYEIGVIDFFNLFGAKKKYLAVEDR